MGDFMKSGTSIVFTGDIGFDRYMNRKWEDAGLLSDSVFEFFKSAEHVCANVEGAMIRLDDDGSGGAFFHTMDPAAAGFLKNIGADLWCIANNHAMDAGTDGVTNTRKIAAESGAVAFGAGKDAMEASEPVYVDGAGGIGLIAVCYRDEHGPATEDEAGTFYWNDIDRLAERISEIKSKCRWCVIVAHGGEEFAPMPLEYTRGRYIRYLELGADAVVAHHPHVPENYELFDNGKAIFYSLGNFIFDTDYQRAHLYTDRGVLLKLTFTENELSFEALGTKTDRENGKILEAPLPEIFTNVPENEYSLLSPLGARAFVCEDMRKMIYLEPSRFENATRETWNSYFFSTEPDGYLEGEHMDFHLIIPWAEAAETDEWKRSKLESVKKYLLSLI